MAPLGKDMDVDPTACRIVFAHALRHLCTMAA
jgi:hypothetical protein